MASPTKKTKVRRLLKKAKMGKRRKNWSNLHGSTSPNLPLDQPNAEERGRGVAVS